MRSKKVALLVFNNFTNDSRVLKEAISLSKSQYDVEVIAHCDIDLETTEYIEGIKIRRVSYLNRKKASIFRKIYAYLIYIIQAIKLARKKDIVHCNDLNTLPISFLIKKILNKKIKVIYDAHEYETEMNHLSTRSKKIMYFLEKRLIKHVDQTITVSKSIAMEYKRLYPFINTPKVVLNCPVNKSLNLKNDLFRTKFNIPRANTIYLYQGSLSKGRGLENIIEAFKQMHNKLNVLVIMGYGNLENYIKETALKYENIFFHDAVSPSVLLNYTSSADFGISTIEDTCLSYHYCLPNKMFEYIMAEIPLVVSNLPEMKKVVKESQLGTIVKENTPEGIIKAVDETAFLDIDKTKSNLLEAKKIYNWENQEKVLLNAYKNLENG